MDSNGLCIVASLGGWSVVTRHVFYIALFYCAAATSCRIVKHTGPQHVINDYP